MFTKALGPVLLPPLPAATSEPQVLRAAEGVPVSPPAGGDKPKALSNAPAKAARLLPVLVGLVYLAHASIFTLSPA